MYTILITGGTGMIGKALTKALLEKDYNVIILTRNPWKQTSSASRLSYAGWDIVNQTIDKDAIIKADYIIHLAGAGIANKRWTKKRKQEIVDSRVKSGKLLAKTLKENVNNVKAVISASAIGWYLNPHRSPQSGEGNTRKLEETDPPAEDFLGQTCKQWEESLEPVTQLDKRLVKLRTGIVLSNEGGALKEFIRPLRFGIATILSNGKQVISWIHVDDLVRIYIAAIENENMNGVYNAVAPRPVSNKELVLQLAKIKRGRFFVPIHVPSFILKLVLGELSIEVLKSTTVSCDKIHFTGFTFLYPSLEAALKQLASTA
jgi:uncharacterized protein (TIGR01777 family)